MNSKSVAKYSAEFNLQTQIDVSGLSEDQFAALKKRLLESNISVASATTGRQMLLEAAMADADNAIDSAIKLEQASSDYRVDAEMQSGSAKTSILMSSKGDANYRSCLFTVIVILGIVGIIAYIAFGR